MKKFLFYFVVLFLAGICVLLAIEKKYPDTEVAKRIGAGREEVIAKCVDTYDGLCKRIHDARAPKPSVAATPKSAPEASVDENEKVEVEPEASEQPLFGFAALVEKNRYSGKRLTAKDFKDKIAIVYEWDMTDELSVAMLPRIQRIADGYGHKPIVVLASHRGVASKKVLDIVRKHKLKLSVYQDAGVDNEPRGRGYPFIYVVNREGSIVYRGKSDLSATEALVNAL